MSSALRASSFVVLHVAVVALYLDALVGVLPPLMLEGRELVVVPVTVVASIAFAGMHPWLTHARTHLGRIAVFSLFAAAGVAAFTGFLLTRIAPPDPTLGSALGLAAIFVLAELLYGAPLFLGLLVLMKLGSPLFIARPVRGWA